MSDYGFFYIFAIDRYPLFLEDMEAIKKSKGRLQLNYNKLESECILKFGISSNIETLFKRMQAHRNSFPDACKPEIKLLFAVFIPEPYQVEYNLKSEFGREWVLPKELVEYLTAEV